MSGPGEGWSIVRAPSVDRDTVSIPRHEETMAPGGSSTTPQLSDQLVFRFPLEVAREQMGNRPLLGFP
jgi:hypothetical protein